MEQRTCRACGSDLSAMSIRAIYCGNACRRWVDSGHTEPRAPRRTTCLHCGSPFAGKLVQALYCTRKCKNAASEARRVRDDHARYLRERERRIAYALAYAAANPQVGQRTKRRRRALLSGAGVFQVSARDWRRMCARFDWRCFYCRRGGVTLTMDHVIPVVRGGRHSIGNLLPACASCNASKNFRTVMEWRLSRRGR